jgi:hypothetical protein
MMRMLLYLTGGMMVGLGLLFGPDAVSYMRTAYQQWRQEVRDQVPLEFELQRASTMLADLGPEIRKHRETMAYEEEQLQGLGQQAQRLEDFLTGERQAILRLKADLESGRDKFFYADGTYSRQEVQADLERRFGRYQMKEDTQKQLRQVIEARRRSLAAAGKQVEAMQVAQRDLQVEVENLQARLRMVEAAQAAGKLEVEEGSLSRTRELLDHVRSRILVAERVLAEESDPQQIPVDAEPEPGVLQRVAEHFGSEVMVEPTVGAYMAPQPEPPAAGSAVVPSSPAVEATAEDSDESEMHARFRAWLQIWLDSLFQGELNGTKPKLEESKDVENVLPAMPASDGKRVALRRWSDDTGRYSTEAVLVQIAADKAHLRKADGAVAVVPLTRLSPADRAYVAEKSTLACRP